MPLHPDKRMIQDALEDVRCWNMEMNHENGIGEDDELSEDEREYREMLGMETKYDYDHDPEFEEQFRGHVVVACTCQRTTGT